MTQTENVELIFCANVKELRKKNNLSKREMAKRLGIGVKSLTLIENGIIPPRLNCEILFYIRKSFGVKPSDLFRGK